MTDQALRIQEELISHPRNLGIEYDPEPHTYTRYFDNGNSTMYDGVTSLIGNYAPFEKKKIQQAMLYSDKYDYNSIEEIEADWKKARDHGTEVHDGLEHWVKTGEYSNKPHVQGMINFCQEYEMTPILAEFTVYCDELKRATPIDIPLVNKYGQLVIGDYKTSKSIKKDHYEYRGNKKKMEYPLTHLPTSNYYKYSLQIAMPRTWLDRYYNLSFDIAPYGYIFHIRDGVFTPHKTLPMNSEIQKIYEWEAKMG